MLDAAPARHDDGASRFKQIEPAICQNAYATGGTQFPHFDARNGKLVPIVSHLRPWQTKHFDDETKFECAEPVIGNGNNERIFKFRG